MTLIIKNLSLKKRGRWIFQDVSLTIEKGGSLSIMGPSGSGKTSLARAILGLEAKEALSGNIDFANPKPRLAYVAQELALWPHLTVENNVKLAIKFAHNHNNNSPLHEWATSLLDFFALTNLRKRFVHELSGGEQSRLALARAISTRPDFIIFDEPLSALDQASVITLIKTIKDLQKHLQFGAIYITHDQKEALALGDSVMTLNSPICR